MASKMQTLMILFFTLFTFSSSRPDNGGIAIYWGQNSNEGTLTATCDSGKYKIVLLAFLNVFGAGRTPAWNFAGHCDNGAITPCTALASEIEYCQGKDIKVLLSIGGAPDYSDYSISSAEDAKEVANYLYRNFLSGQYGPLGSVYLDGIDFDIEKTEDHWDDLARELDALRQTRRFLLSAAPQCPIPVYYLGKAIATGLFDYIFVQFYNNPVCSYSNGNYQPVLAYWDKWVDLVEAKNSLFLGLPAAQGAAGSGYIPPKVVNENVLPYIKKASNYEGVMLWNRYFDRDTNFSGNIISNVLKSVLRSVTSLSNAIYECVSKALNRFYVLPNVN